MLRLRHLFIALTLTLGVVACSPADPSAQDGTPVVHASGPVWASVATAVAGEYARVTSTAMSATQDPHSYEPSAQDKLAFSKADVVVLNGGHYDEWAEELVTSLGMQSAVIDAMALSGQHDNEHVFQSIPTAMAVGSALAERLAKADPEHARAFRDNAAALTTTLTTLLSGATNGAARHSDATVVATETVSSMLVNDLGLTDITPEEYTTQSETNEGPSVAVLARAVDLVRSGEVSLLLVNAQTGDEASTRLEQAARESGVPVVGVHETMPEGVDSYAAYMRLHIDAILEALR